MGKLHLLVLIDMEKDLRLKKENVRFAPVWLINTFGTCCANAICSFTKVPSSPKWFEGGREKGQKK